MDKEKKSPAHSEMRRVKPSEDAIAAALEAAQRLATETDAEQAVAGDIEAGRGPGLCDVCGHRNKDGNKFCGMCGVVLPDADELKEDDSLPRGSHGGNAQSYMARPSAFGPGAVPPAPAGYDHGHPSGAIRPAGVETHHYHHHYHYFQGGYDGSLPRAADPQREAERMRPSAVQRGDMSRAEAAVRRIAQEWVLACNTKHLDDLLDLYVADALVLRSNYPPIRGAAAVREFFFGALDAGLGEVEVEPLRVEVIGDLAYEAGRCKALVPGAAGKRREERGKYLWVCARQAGGEWKLTADCWSSDLALTTMESDVPPSTGVKTREPRKNS